MPATVLHLRAAERPQRPPDAWFIPGDDPRVWLEELAAWQIPLDDVRLCPLPQSAAGGRACGVLVIPPPGSAPRVTIRAEAYGLCASRFYLPILSRLDPPASEAEIEAAVLNELAVWHPGAGLVGFDKADVIGVADLLAPPSERSRAWDLARPGLAPPPRLTAILTAAPPGFEESLADWRDDIGSRPVEELPPGSQEPLFSRLARLPRKAILAVACVMLILAIAYLASNWPAAPVTLLEVVLWLALALLFARLLPSLVAAGVASASDPLLARIAKMPAWAIKLAGWANRKFQQVGKSLAAARHKEIDRLLHLLDSDPDGGLRYALPMNAIGGHRGVGPPGTRLPARDTSFRLDRLGGGRAADPWEIEQQQRQALERRYRELANREMRLGRHRRAAYIFAELLGDLSAAASALEQGGHDREAAALYRERLGRPLDAARCLERCGSWQEALDIYRDQQQFEKAAELLTRLDRPDEAAVMYRRAADRFVAQGDRPRAAKLLEEKLAAVDEAIKLLAAAWPDTRKAAICLGELFKLFGRHGRHEQAAALIARLRAEPGLRVQLGRSVGVLVDVARSYPEVTARHEAAEAVRVLAGGRLPQADQDEAAALVGAVRALVPQDELLGRDAARWLARLRKPSVPAKAPVRSSPRQVAIVETGSFRLPVDVSYRTLVSLPDGFLAAGFTAQGVAVVEADFQGELQRADWKRPLAERQPLLLAADERGHVTVMASIGGSPFKQQIGIGTPAWFTPETLAVAVSSLGVTWTIDSQLLLTAFQGEALQLSSRQLSLSELGVRLEPREEPPERLAVMLARRDELFLGLGHSLIKLKNDRIQETGLKGWVRQLAAAPLVLQLRLAAGFEDHGAAVIWDDLNGHEVVNIVADMERPELIFTLDGLLVAANERELHVYSTSNRSVVLRGLLAGPGRPLTGLIRGERPGEFALLTIDGLVRRYAARETD
ncbi:MAG TPA: hypothetical protein VF278_00125 [Pirellulales bacterium]